VPLIHRYPLESHGVVTVAPLGTETRPIFRTYWNHYTGAATSFKGQLLRHGGGGAGGGVAVTLLRSDHAAARKLFLGS
jgi:hypothetical protein